MNTRKSLRIGLIVTATLVLLTALTGRMASAQSTPTLDISITKSATFGANSATFTLAVTNVTNPPVTLTKVTVRDQVPTAYAITTSAADIQASCTATCTATVAGNLVTVVFPTLVPGQTGQFSFTAAYLTGVPVTNVAVVQGERDGVPTVERRAEVSPPTPPSGVPNTGEGTIFDSAPVAAWGMAAVVVVLVTAFGLATVRRRIG